MTATMLAGHCRMRVLLPVRFVNDIDALAVAYQLGSYLALSQQVEVTCEVVTKDEEARRLFPLELRTLDDPAERWGIRDVELRPEDGRSVMELSHSFGTHPGKVIAALCWHMVRCFLKADQYATRHGISQAEAFDTLFPSAST